MRLALMLSLLLLGAHGAWANPCTFNDPELETRPGHGKGPTQVTLRLYINDIIAIHDVDQSFEADVVFRVEWHDPRLAHDNPVACNARPDQVWTPVMQLLNRRSVQQIRKPELSVFPDGSVLFLLRSFGEYSFRADLTDFPFDSQALSFNIVSTYGEDDVQLITNPELFGLGEALSVANWTIDLTGTEGKAHYVAPVDRHLARMDFKLRAQRLTGYYTWQQLLPLFLVVMMTWLVFWIPFEFVPARVGLAATAMLTLIAYRFAMSSVLPPIAYLTRLDTFMIGASVLVFLGLVAAVAVSYLFEARRDELAVTVNKSARWLSPVLLVAVALGAFFF